MLMDFKGAFRGLLSVVLAISLLSSPTLAAGSSKKKKGGTYSKVASKKPKTVYKSVRLSKSKKVAPPEIYVPKQKVPADIRTPVDLAYTDAGEILFNDLPHFNAVYRGKVTGISSENDYIMYSLDPDLQRYAVQLVNETQSPHIAIVAMEPQTGRILALAERSHVIDHPVLHSGFPAASLFKIVTASAALETGTIVPFSKVFFRGGTYTLDKTNFAPDEKRDRLSMTVAEALGKSCNPVFARIALKYLSPNLMRHYANSFGFNSPLQFEAPLPKSIAYVPDDDFGLSRTAAGFGDVTISPLHAVTMMAAIANGGMMPKPKLVDQVLSSSGNLKYQDRSSTGSRRALRPDTARTLLRMMEATTTVGTSRRAFMAGNKPLLPVSVAGKTGTLRGDNPKGLNNWFIAAAPIESPKIAVSVIVVNPASVSAKASQIGRRVIESYLVH